MSIIFKIWENLISRYWWEVLPVQCKHCEVLGMCRSQSDNYRSFVDEIEYIDTDLYIIWVTDESCSIRRNTIDRTKKFTIRVTHIS